MNIKPFNLIYSNYDTVRLGEVDRLIKNYNACFSLYVWFFTLKNVSNINGSGMQLSGPHNWLENAANADGVEPEGV